MSDQVVLKGIIDHHERVDGQGYPEGKKGENISLVGRIIGVADTFDALTSDRPYRKGKSKEEALQILKKAAGTQLDSKIVDAFLKLDNFSFNIQSLIALTIS